MLLFKLIDPEWLSTIASTGVTIFVFLLGVPYLLLQTFIREGLKELYSKHITRPRLFFPFVILGLMLSVMLLYFCNSSAYLSFWNSSNLENSEKEGDFIFWGVIFFTTYVAIVVYHFYKSFDNSKNFVNILTQKIVNDLVNPNTTLDKKESLIQDLTMISELLLNNVERKSYIKEIHKCAVFFMNPHYYYPTVIHKIYTSILTPVYRNSKDCDDELVNESIDFANILLKDREILWGTDSAAVISKLVMYATISLENGYNKCFDIAVKVLREVENGPANLLHLFTYASRLGKSNMVLSELFALKRNANNSNSKYSINFNACLALLYSDQRFAGSDLEKRILTTFPKQLFNKQDIQMTKQHFLMIGDIANLSYIQKLENVLASNNVW